MKRTALILLSSACVAAGCADREADMAAQPAAAPKAAAPAAAEADGRSRLASDKAGAKTPARAERKLIHNAELRVEVASYPEARRALDKQLASVQGYVADARIEHHDGEVSRAVITLRIPSEQLSAFLADAAGYGKVMHESISTQDITDAYYDTQARLKNGKRLEARLLELLANKTDGVKDLLEVERELARVREQIERHEGQLQLFDSKVALSTLQLELTTRRVYTAGTAPTFGERVSNTLGASFGALLAVGYGIVIAAIALVPWLLPLALLFWFCRRLWLRRAKRRLAKQPQQAPPPYGPTVMPVSPATLVL